MTSTQAPALPAEGLTEIHPDGRITHTMGSRYALAGMVYTAPLTVGAKVTAKVTIWNEAGNDCDERTRTGIVTGAEYDGRTANWWVYEITLADGTVAHSRTPKVAKARGERKASTPRSKVAKPTGPLPKIVAYVGIDDSGDWATFCLTHGRFVTHQTRRLAEYHLSNPTGWCEVCSGSESPDDESGNRTTFGNPEDGIR